MTLIHYVNKYLTYQRQHRGKAWYLKQHKNYYILHAERSSSYRSPRKVGGNRIIIKKRLHHGHRVLPELDLREWLLGSFVGGLAAFVVLVVVVVVVTLTLVVVTLALTLVGLVAGITGLVDPSLGLVGLMVGVALLVADGG